MHVADSLSSSPQQWSDIIQSLTILRSIQDVLCILQFILSVITVYWWNIYDRDPVLRLRWPSRSQMCIIGTSLWCIPRQIGWYLPNNISCAIPYSISILLFWITFEIALSLLFHLYTTFNLTQHQLETVLGRTSKLTINNSMPPGVSTTQQDHDHAMESSEKSKVRLSMIVPLNTSEDQPHQLLDNGDRFKNKHWNFTFGFAPNSLTQMNRWHKLIFAYITISIVLYIAIVVMSLYEYYGYAFYCPTWTITQSIATGRAAITSCIIIALAFQLHVRVDRLGVKAAWVRAAKSCIIIFITVGSLFSITLFYPDSYITKVLFTVQETIPLTGALVITYVLYTIPAYKARQRSSTIAHDCEDGHHQSFSCAVLFLHGATSDLIELRPRYFASSRTLRLFLATKEGLNAFAILAAEKFTTESLLFYCEVTKYEKLWDVMKKATDDNGVMGKETKCAIEKKARYIYSQ